MNIVARKSGIIHRYSVLEDFQPSDRRSLFNGHNPKVEERMQVYQREALPLAMKAIEQLRLPNIETITHLISVSCTGLSAPGLELQIAQELGLEQHCARHAVNFIGCHGAFHALKMAQQMVAAKPQSRVLIVSVELCSLHFQPSDDDDSILANALFGDGAAACLVSSQNTRPSIELEQFSQFFFPEEDRHMAWNVHSEGFLLRLSSYVPSVIEKAIPSLFSGNSEIDPEGLWAVHPGGKNILEAVEHALELPGEKLEASRKTLREVGNLSSATVLFVLKELLENSTGSKPVNALGFGPGITIEHFSGKLHA